MTSVAILLIQDPVKNPALQGAGVTQWVKCPILDLGSGLDLRVVALSTMWGTTLRMEPTLKKEKRTKEPCRMFGCHVSLVPFFSGVALYPCRFVVFLDKIC